MGSKFLISFAALVAAFLIFYFGAWDRFQKLQVTGEEVRNAEKSLLQSEKIAKELREAGDRIAKNKDALKKIDSVFLKDGNVEDAVFAIEKLATTHGMALIDIRLKEKYPVKTAGGQVFPIPFLNNGENQKNASGKTFALAVSTRLAGGYDNFKIFLESIQKTLPLIGIPELAISPPANPLDPLFLFDVEFVLYEIE